jgi:hypothetical protein
VLGQKLKQQQEKKAAPAPTPTPLANDQAGSQDVDAATPTSPPSAASTVPAATATGVTPPKQVTATNPLSAVERPEQRNMRADAVALKSRCTRAICLQGVSIFNQTILNEQTKLLTQRLQDEHASHLLQQKKTDYVPSSDDYCADSEALFATNENSVFSRPHPSESISVNLSTFTTVLDFAVLPGIESKDDSLNP